MTRTDPPDDWYRSERPTRVELIFELQRIKRRTLNRPIPVILLAALITTVIVRKVVTKPVVLQSEVVLAMTEGALARQEKGIPFMQLREYVNSVLLPDNKLVALIEKYNLTRLRKKLGMQYALEELRSSFEIQIWKNSFVYFDDEDEHARRSARIGISVTDSDPDRALDIARALAGIIIETSADRRRKFAAEISEQVASLRDATNEKLDQIEHEMSDKQAAINEAMRRGRPDVAGVLRIDLASLVEQRGRVTEQLSQIASSPDAMASEVTAANLDMSLAIVDERRPERPTHSSFVFVMVGVVVGTGALLASALVLGAFDSRVHDPDDVARLGLPVLGHVPGFAGDNVGSMRTRSAARARVPSFQRWRSHR